MKITGKAILLLLALAVLLGGGGILYKTLSSRTQTDGAEEERAASAERHRMDAPRQDDGEPVPDGRKEEPGPAEPVPPEATPVPLSGDTAADFRVLDESGSYVSLSDFFGKPIIVNIWATWCPPCRMELPSFNAAYEAYGDRIAFLMVDLTDGGTDTVESATAFIREENGFTFPLFFDVDYSAAEACEVSAIPVTLFIRADGSLLYRQVGMLDDDTLQSYIQQLLD